MTATLTGFDWPDDNEAARREYRESLNELCKIKLDMTLVQFLANWGTDIALMSDEALEFRARVPDSWLP